MSKKQTPKITFWRALRACLPVIFNKKVRNAAIYPAVPNSSGAPSSTTVAVTCEKIDCAEIGEENNCLCYRIRPVLPGDLTQRINAFKFNIVLAGPLPAGASLSLEYQGRQLNHQWANNQCIQGEAPGSGPVFLKICYSAGDAVHNLGVQVTGLIVIANISGSLIFPPTTVVRLLELAANDDSIKFKE